MASTHSSLYVHVIFGTKHLEQSIELPWRKRLHAFLGGCVATYGAQAIAVNGVSDHVHVLLSFSPPHQLSALVRDMKRESSRWVHQEMGVKGFEWQVGYGIFTVSRSKVPAVKAYIADQAEHHRTRLFREEYEEFLQRHEVAYDPQYLP